MNYLAHAYLSFGDQQILAGNIFSDFVKGKRKFEFPERIQAGMSLHRSIDKFTDDHPATHRGKQYFRPAYRLYASAFMDIVYDHFLARDPTIFGEGELAAFSSATYEQLKLEEPFFPPQFRIMFHYMEKQNWLYNYQFKEGIFKSFGGLVRRASFINDPGPACEVLVEHYEALEECYEEFMPEVRQFVVAEFPVN